MPRKSKPTRKKPPRSYKTPTPDAAFIDAPQLLSRFGGRSHMWLVRLLERDKSFPRPLKIGRLRFFSVADLAAWERKTATKTHAA